MEDILNSEDCLQKVKSIRDRFEKTLREKFPNIQFFGEEVKRIANTSFLSLPGTAHIQDELQMRKYLSPPHQLALTKKVNEFYKMNIEPYRSGAIRVSFCSKTTEEDCDVILDALSEIFYKLNKTH